ncbi:MAG: ribonuclease HII, partial [Candidatus Levyibacteriota bacterium]
IIRGDATVFSIALASIIAKVNRDTYMETLSSTFPEYGFAKHKGYGTALHRGLLKEHGPCAHHRTQFIEKWV